MTDRLPAMSPGEVLDYRIDAAGLLDGDDTLTGATVVSATGATLDSIDVGDDAVTLWLSGATLGRTIVIEAVLKTSGGRTFARRYVIPYLEPISLAMAKKQCRIELADDEDDELIAGYIRAAREWVERYTGVLMVRRPVIEARDDWGAALTLYRGPDVADVTVRYLGAGGEIDFDGFRLRGNRLIATGAAPSVARGGEITVRYTAGYAAGGEPDVLLQAILMLVAHFYANREAVVTGGAATAIPMAVEALCDRVRMPVL